MANAIRALVTHEHLIAEGAGAAGLAAVLAGKIQIADRRVVVIVSGGNIDTARLARILGGREPAPRLTPDWAGI
jgi:threonine dehydratase